MDQPTTPATQADLDEFLGVEPPSPWVKRLKWAGIALVVIAVLYIGYRLIFGSAAEVNYATRAVERDDLTVSISATGNLQPTNQVDVGSELSGLVEHVYVDNNDRVTRGQVLARLDTQRLQDAINQSRAGLASAQASVGQARATAMQAAATLRRQEEVHRLSGGKVPSQTELDAARAENARAIAAVRAAQASVAQAQAQLSADQTQFSKASIVSPVTGVVLSRQIEPGQTVAASLNAPVLFVIAEDLSRMRLEVKVDEADVGQVAAGQRASFQVDAFPGRTFPAMIERVDVGANASGSTTTSSSTSAAAGSVVAYTARLTVANDELLLRPGMTATADIITAEKKNALLVPNAALRFNPDAAARGASGGQRGGLAGVMAPTPPRRGNRGGGDRSVTIGRGSSQTVYVLDAEGKPQPVRVVVGDSNGSQTEILSGDLKEGTRVITGQLAPGETDRGGDRQSAGSERRRDREQGAPAATGAPSAAAPGAQNPAAAAVTAPATQPMTNSGGGAGTPESAPTATTAPAERAAAGEGRRGTLTDAERAERRERFQNMSEEERAAFRKRRHAEREGGSPDGQ